jgi:hypothetical protein
MALAKNWDIFCFQSGFFRKNQDVFKTKQIENFLSGQLFEKQDESGASGERL